jgi:hypothetical protein
MRDFTKQMTNPQGTPERQDLAVSSAEVRAAGDLGNKPLIVISHSHDWKFDPDLPKGLS